MVITSASADRQAAFQKLRQELINKNFLTREVLNISMPFSKVPLITYTIVLKIYLEFEYIKKQSHNSLDLLQVATFTLITVSELLKVFLKATLRMVSLLLTLNMFHTFVLVFLLLTLNM